LSFFRYGPFRATVISVLAAGLLVAQTTTPPSAVDQRIQGIQDGLMPAVMVEGESSRTIKLTDRMAALHVPGVSVAVIHAGKIEWARGFGVTRIGGSAVTPETLFQAASISKPLTALAVLRLVESGKLNLDTDVNKYLQTWKVPENQFTAKNKVTLRELLSHTAGITVHGFAGYASGEQLPSVMQVLNGEKPANSPAIRVDVEPGSTWRYSGGGYVIVQQLLEDVTGKPFPRLMQEMVLGPIGMGHSTYEQPLPTRRLVEAAIPYFQDGQPVPGGPHIYPEMAPAGLWTTPSDLARYALEVQKILAGESNGVLSVATARQMLAPGMNHWGLGPQTGGSKEHPYFTHEGENDGFACDLVAYDDDDGAVIMTNGDNGGQIAAEMLRTIAYEYKWPDFQPARYAISKIDPKVFDGYVGAYQLTPTLLLAIRREGNRFITQGTGQEAIEIFPESDHDFFAKVIDAQVTFVTDSQGHATELILHQHGDRHAPRVEGDAAALAPKIHKEIHINPTIFDAYVGSYQLGPGFILSVSRNGDRFYTHAAGQEPVEIFPESDHDFFAKDFDAQVTFLTDSHGHTTELILHRGGVFHAPRIQQTP
jgi:CubicO group peptidase (beta-lactamase class C family)